MYIVYLGTEEQFSKYVCGINIGNIGNRTKLPNLF